MSRLFPLRITILVFLCIAAFKFSICQESGSECRVLLKEISGSYTGPCKDGLANGKGSAKGEDSYTGGFLNGLPDGKGVYKYKNGNIFSGYWEKGLKNGKGEFKYLTEGKATVVSGYWKDGEYKGTEKPDEFYRITNISGIENYSISKAEGNENMIEISFEKAMKKYIPNDLTVNLSSGNTIDQTMKLVVQHYSLPVNCSLHFTIPIAGERKQCNFAFTIYEKGTYKVHITNN